MMEIIEFHKYVRSLRYRAYLLFKRFALARSECKTAPCSLRVFFSLIRAVSLSSDSTVSTLNVNMEY